MSSKYIILFTVFIDILGLGIIIPILPFYVESLGGSAIAVGMLFSVYALCSFLSAPLLGVLSDRFGRRPVLIGSITSTAIGWFVFASGISLPILFLGRIIDGLAAGNISTAQSYLSDLATTDKERTANLGLIGALFGIGLAVGPLLGGLLGAVSHTLPFWVVGAMAAVNAALAMFFLPETHKPQKEHRLHIRLLNPFAPLVRATKTAGLRGLFVAYFFFTLAFSAQQSIFALYLGREFGFAELGVGIILTITGVLLALNQGVLLKRFWIEKFEEKDLALWMFAVLSVGMLLMAVPLMSVFFIGMVVSVIGQSTLRTVLTSTISGFVPKKRGENLGTMSSVMSLGLVVGPAIVGPLFTYATAGPFILSAGWALLGMLTVWRVRRTIPNLTAVPDLPPETFV